MRHLIEEMKKLNKVCQKPHYKEAGNWMVRNIIRDACVPMTYLLLKTPITANQVTFFSLLLGIGGCIVFLISTKLSFLWLALLLHLSYYFDHVDGQIARCKSQVSLSGMMFDFISHYIIFAIILLSLGLKAYFLTSEFFYIYCGMVASIAIISFNLLSDSKYRAFFVEIMKHKQVGIRGGASRAKKERQPILARGFSLIHKTCEIHVIINTVTVVAILDIFGLNSIIAFSVDVGWTQVLVVYYTLASLFIAASKISYFVATKKPDEEFKRRFRVERD